MNLVVGSVTGVMVLVSRPNSFSFSAAGSSQ